MNDDGGTVTTSEIDCAVTVSIQVRKEGDRWPARCPRLQLSAHGPANARLDQC